MVLGVIAEYNPFHNGHAYHISRSKELSGACAAIAVMSGDFVQRGEPAMFGKRQRAKWALQNGVDMVIALPAPFSLCCAELFALAGVRLLSATGLVSCISFGSESADIDTLRLAAEYSLNEPAEVSASIREGLASGLPYPRARALAYGMHFPGIAAAISSPNDMLGIEYLKAVSACAPEMQAVAVGRRGAAHDSSDTASGFASASALRGMTVSGKHDELREFVPQVVYEDILHDSARMTSPITLENLSKEAVYALRRMDKPQLAALPDVSEGLENLIYSACRENASLNGILGAIKSRRYTLARLKRICMCALLGVTTPPRELMEGLYIRVLGVRRDSMHLLSELESSARLPVIVRRKDLDKLNEKQLRLHDIDVLAHEIALLGAPEPQPARSEYSDPLLTV